MNSPRPSKPPGCRSSSRPIQDEAPRTDVTDEEERVGGPFRIGIWWGLIGSFDGAHKRPPGGRSGAGSLLVTLPFPAAEMQGGSGRPPRPSGHPRRLPAPRFSGSLETEEQAESSDTRGSRSRNRACWALTRTSPGARTVARPPRFPIILSCREILRGRCRRRTWTSLPRSGNLGFRCAGKSGRRFPRRHKEYPVGTDTPSSSPPRRLRAVW